MDGDKEDSDPDSIQLLESKSVVQIRDDDKDDDDKTVTTSHGLRNQVRR